MVSGERSRPNLFIVGAPKCGTTAWFEYLREHESIFFPAVKEPLHFCLDFPKFRAVYDRTKYEALYSGSEGAPVRGDASVMHLYSQVAAREIASYSPNARILIFVRRQEQFLPSLHNQQLYNGDEVIEDFAEAWRLSGNRTPPPSCRAEQFLDYAAQGRFYEQAVRYIETFGPERVRIFHFDDWKNNPAPFYDEILRFLGVPYQPRTSFPLVNPGKRHRFQWLGRFTQSPPGWALRLAPLIKKVTGLERPPLIDWLRSWNQTTGYRGKGMKPELEAEIRAYYADDNARLDPLIWRPPS